MDTYRLLTGAGEELDQFDAETDAVAADRGRKLAESHPQPSPHHAPRGGAPATRADFRVERRDGDDWSLVHAWVPTPPPAT